MKPDPEAEQAERDQKALEILVYLMRENAKASLVLLPKHLHDRALRAGARAILQLATPVLDSEPAGTTIANVEHVRRKPKP